MNIPLMLKALSLMTQDEAAQYLNQSIDSAAYLECCTERIYGKYHGHTILYAGAGDWKRALENITTKTPVCDSFGTYTFWA
jgi:hypothetical protein